MNPFMAMRCLSEERTSSHWSELVSTFSLGFRNWCHRHKTPTQLERLHARYLAHQMPRQRSNNCMRIEGKNSFDVYNLSSDGSGTGCWGGWDARKTWTGSRTCIVQTMEQGRAGIQSYRINKSLWYSLIRQTLLIPLKKFRELLKILKSNLFHIENQPYQLCLNAAHSVGLVSTIMHWCNQLHSQKSASSWDFISFQIAAKKNDFTAVFYAEKNEWPDHAWNNDCSCLFGTVAVGTAKGIAGAWLSARLFPLLQCNLFYFHSARRRRRLTLDGTCCDAPAQTAKWSFLMPTTIAHGAVEEICLQFVLNAAEKAEKSWKQFSLIFWTRIFFALSTQSSWKTSRMAKGFSTPQNP